MWASLGWFALGLLLLALGGDSIVKGAAGLSRRLGFSPFVAGLVLVTIATSLPELAVNLHAVWRGETGLALGNAVGSNVVNIGLTLGAAAVAAPLLVRWRALSPLLGFLLAGTVVVALLGLDGMLSRIEGIGLVVAFVAVLAFDLTRRREEAPELRAEIEAYTETRGGLGLNLIRFAAIAAARRGQGDMVLGHVVGASLFNLLVVVGGMAVLRPLPVPESFVRLEWPAAFVFALMLVPMLRGDLRLGRREGGILLAAFVGWVLLEWWVIRH